MNLQLAHLLNPKPCPHGRQGRIQEGLIELSRRLKLQYSITRRFDLLHHEELQLVFQFACHLGSVHDEDFRHSHQAF